VDVKILRVDTSDRKIGLSLKRAKWGETTPEEEGAASMDRSIPEAPSRGGMDDHGAMGTDKIEL